MPRPRKPKARPAAAPAVVATLTAYVNAADQRPLLVLARLPGREPRVFPTEHRPRLRPLPGAPPPAPPAEQRAEAWAREMGASEVQASSPRVVHTMTGESPLDAAMRSAGDDLEWLRAQRERRASNG